MFEIGWRINMENIINEKKEYIPPKVVKHHAIKFETGISSIEVTEKFEWVFADGCWIRHKITD